MIEEIHGEGLIMIEDMSLVVENTLGHEFNLIVFYWILNLKPLILSIYFWYMSDRLSFQFPDLPYQRNNFPWIHNKWSTLAAR